jgi:hypothetical protein
MATRLGALATLILAPALLLRAQGQPAAQLANASLQVNLSANGALSIVDLASGAHWNSVAPQKSSTTVTNPMISADGTSLTATLAISGVSYQLSIALASAEPAFDLTLSGDSGTALGGNIMYPLPIQAPTGAYRMAVPQKSGLLFTVADAAGRAKFLGHYDTYNSSGLTMPWVGITDVTRGLMIVLDTPMDSGVDVELSGTGANQSFTLQPYWYPVKGTLGYARKLRYRLFTSGGYVAMCKYYRNGVIQAGNFVTLRQKQAALPQLSKLIGVLDLYMKGDTQDSQAVITYLESKGVNRMLVNSGGSAQRLGWFSQRGYLVGSYEIYSDIDPPAPGEGLNRTSGYPQDAYTQADGTPIHGFQYSSTNQSTYRCSLRQLPLMQQLIPPLLQQSTYYQAMFLDVETSLSPTECYSAAHPLDRRGDIQQRIANLQYAGSLGLVIGSEDGNDWAAPYLAYFEGMVMTRRFGMISSVTISNWPQPFDLTDEYINVDLNEQVRAPLWDLVFHDSIVSTWRWEYTPDRYSDPTYWDKQDLIYILGGDMPIFNVDQQLITTDGDRIVQTYNNVSQWNAKIGWDELVDHLDLTADRSVQESRFSSGWAVTVNFSDTASFTTSDRVLLKPYSFRTYRWNAPAAPRRHRP